MLLSIPYLENQSITTICKIIQLKFFFTYIRSNMLSVAMPDQIACSLVYVYVTSLIILTRRQLHHREADLNNAEVAKHAFSSSMEFIVSFVQESLIDWRMLAICEGVIFSITPILFKKCSCCAYSRGGLLPVVIVLYHVSKLNLRCCNIRWTTRCVV